MVQRRFERVVVCVGNRPLQFDAAERRPKLGSRRLLVERAARRAQAQAQRRIGRIRFFKHQQMMRRSAHVAHRGQRRRAELPLHARHPVLCVGRYVVRIDGRNAHQRLKLAPVHARIRIRAARSIRHMLQREIAAPHSRPWPQP